MAIPQADFAKLPTFAQDAYKKIIGQAANIADRPINAAALAPDLDPFQQQAGALLTQGLGSYVPYLEQAAQYAGPQGADASIEQLFFCFLCFALGNNSCNIRIPTLL